MKAKLVAQKDVGKTLGYDVAHQASMHASITLNAILKREI